MTAERGARGDDLDEDLTVVASDETVVVARAVDPAVPTGLSAPDPDPTAEVAPASASVEAAELPGYDRRYRISAVPGVQPWEAEPVPEPGVHPNVPVTYGPRSSRDAAAFAGPDEVLKRLGPPPEATPVTVRAGRAGLPSFGRRERRSRTLTLVAYPLAVLAALAGLAAIAMLVFT